MSMTSGHNNNESVAPTTRNESDISIPKRILVGLTAGALSGLSVAPFVTTIDKAIVQNASGAATMKDSIKGSIRDILRRPHQFVRRYEFGLIFGLYSATYQSANLIDTFYDENPDFAVSKDMGKFLGVSAVNMTLCIYKDRCFARHFGTIKATKVPVRSFGLWAMRDLMTILAAFNIPHHGAAYLHENYNQYFQSEVSAFTFCQLLSPIFIQLFSTPLHLAGLDMYNNPTSTIKLRMAFIRKEYVKSLLGRMCRIFPAFSLGGLGNKFYHDTISDYVLDKPMEYMTLH